MCKLQYTIKDITKDNHLVIGIAGANDNGETISYEKHADLVGKVIEMHSLGNLAARGILVHLRLKYPVTYSKICTDEAHGKPYGESSEFNLKVDNLNPTDVLRVLIYCRKDHVQPGEDILQEHRVTLSEGKAKKVDRW